jgi:hypothetical protein
VHEVQGRTAKRGGDCIESDEITKRMASTRRVIPSGPAKIIPSSINLHKNNRSTVAHHSHLDAFEENDSNY